MDYGRVKRALSKDFLDALEDDKELAAIYKIIDAKRATHVQSYGVAQRVSNAAGRSLQRNITAELLPTGEIPLELANTAIKPIINGGYNMITNAGAAIQNSMNSNAGLGLKAVAVTIDPTREPRLLQTMASVNIVDTPGGLFPSLENYFLAAVDELIRQNAEFQYQAGLTPHITRTAAPDCCDWCAALAGRYEYPDGAPKDVFRRHKNCHCMTLYNPADGSKMRQDVWSKKWLDNREITAREKRIELDAKNRTREPQRPRFFSW